MSRRLLLVALLLLAALLAWGFHGQPLVAAFAALPPALIAAALVMGLRSAGFWAGVFALGWFSYGVMEAWTLHGTARLYALGILALSLVIVIASSWAGLRARFGRKTPD